MNAEWCAHKNTNLDVDSNNHHSRFSFKAAAWKDKSSEWEAEKKDDPKITVWMLGIMLIQHWATLWKHLFCIRPVFLRANGN